MVDTRCHLGTIAKDPPLQVDKQRTWDFMATHLLNRPSTAVRSRPQVDCTSKQAAASHHRPVPPNRHTQRPERARLVYGATGTSVIPPLTTWGTKHWPCAIGKAHRNQTSRRKRCCDEPSDRPEISQCAHHRRWRLFRKRLDYLGGGGPTACVHPTRR